MKLNKNHICKLSLFLIMMPVLMPIYSEIAVGQDSYCLSTIEYPPLFQKNETPGKGYGIARDITTEAFLAMGHKVTYKIIPMGKKGDGVKKETSMILCFYWQEVESFKENHKIIDVPNTSLRPQYFPFQTDKLDR